MSIPDNLLRDENLIGEIISQCDSEKILAQLPIDKLKATEVKEFLEISVKEGVDSAFEQFPDDKGRLAEAIILTVGRPAILVQNNSFTVDTSDVWAARLEVARANIEAAIRSVGRIEVTNHPRGFVYLGTGWLVAPDIIVTNRHVAEAFAKKEGNEFSFRKNTILNQKIGVNIDFREEFQIDAQEQFEALKVLYIEENDSPDIAFIQISKRTLVGGAIFDLSSDPIPLIEDNIQDESEIAVIGYPAEDGRRNPLPDPELDKIFGDIYDVKRLQPGQIKSVRTDLITHDASTLGGNSGSVVIDLKTGKAVGLHFGGKFMEENYAVPAPVIRDLMTKLSI